MSEQASDSNALAFVYDGMKLRTILVNGDPWFYVSDAASILELGVPSQAIRGLDPELIDDHGVHSDQQFTGDTLSVKIVSEPGLYEMIFRSRKPSAKAFRMWVVKEVLPQIRKTGSYAVASKPKTRVELARELLASEEALEAAEAARLALEAPAKAWTTLGTGEGSWSMAEAAKILAQDHKISTGQNRLFKLLEVEGWLFRRNGEWEPYQSAVDAGWLVAKPQAYQRDGSTVLAKPQIRITPAGIQRLLPILNPSKELV